MPYKDKKVNAEYHRKYLLNWKKNNNYRFIGYYKTYRTLHQDKIKEYNRKKWDHIKNSRPPVICPICNKEFKGPLNKKYCSVKCRDKYWFENKKDNPRYILLTKQRSKKYYCTPKGKQNQFKKYQKRIAKFKDGIIPTKEVIMMVDKRDKVCAYCGKEFAENGRHPNSQSYDHLNSSLPHSEINTVKCCRSCNSSKQDKNILSWMKKKNYSPSKKILQLLKKQESLNALQR